MSRLPFALLLAAAAGCNGLYETGLVEVRVRNASAVIMEDVRIWLSGEPVEYATLEPAELRRNAAPAPWPASPRE